MTERKHVPLGLVILLAATFAAFMPCLWGGYVYDDHRFITRNPYMSGPLDVGTAFTDPGTLQAGGIRDIYRPLRTLLFHVEHHLGGGGPFLHHLSGLLFHLANTVLVFLLLRRILAALHGEGKTAAAALLGAAFFALHPLQVESVAWISSRGDQAAAFFALLALLAALQAHTSPVLLFATFLAAGLAALSKESGVAVPVLIVLAGLLLPPFRRKAVFFSAVAAALAAVAYLVLRAQVLGPPAGQVPFHGGSLLTNTCYALFGLAYDGVLLFRPWFNNLDYQAGFFQSVPWVVVVGGGLCYLALAVILGVRARRGPELAFSFYFFTAALLPSSSLLFPLRSLVNDRYLYLPLAGIGLAAGRAALFIQERRASRILPRIGRFLFLLLLVFLGILSARRTLDWRDGERLWNAALKTHPGSVKARLGLATARFNRGAVHEALRLAEEVIALAQPGSSLATDGHHLAAKALARLGRADRAAAYLRAGLDQAEGRGTWEPFRARMLEMARNLWAFDMKAGNWKGAEEDARRMLRLGGRTAENLLVLGQTLLEEGRFDEAEGILLEASRRAPEDPRIRGALDNLRRTRKRQGKEEMNPRPPGSEPL